MKTPAQIIDELMQEEVFLETYDALCVFMERHFMAWPAMPAHDRPPLLGILAEGGALNAEILAAAAIDINLELAVLREHSDVFQSAVYETAMSFGTGGAQDFLLHENTDVSLMAIAGLFAELRMLRGARDFATNANTQMEFWLETGRLHSLLQELSLSGGYARYPYDFLRLCVREADAAADALLALDRATFPHIGHTAMEMTDSISHFKRKALLTAEESADAVRKRLGRPGPRFKL